MLDFFQILMAVCKILMLLANLLWCHSSHALKLLCQMTLTGEANL